MSIKTKLPLIFTAALMLIACGLLNVSAQTQTAKDDRLKDPDETKPVAIQPKTVSPENINSPTFAMADPRVAGDLDLNSPPIAANPKPNFPTSSSERETTPEAVNPDPSSPDPSGEWKFQLTPYLWLASLHGATGTNTRQAQVDSSFSDIFHTLKFAFMGTFEARKNKLGLVTDLQYISLSDDKGTPGPLFSGVKADVKTFIFDPEVAYRVFDNPEKGAFVDVMGGIRVVHISSDLTFFPGILTGTEVDASRTWVDAVAGLRGKAHLSPKLYVVGKFDLGGGGSKFTFQLFGGLGYEVNPKVTLIFGYRDLDINYRRDNFVYDTSQRGPLMGVGFRF